MDSLEGHFLFSSPHLLDANFVRTVVLLIEHNEQGALGVVLNRPTSKTVKELWKEVGQSPCRNESPVYLGGPVAGPLMALHTAGSLAEIEVVPGVFFAAKKKNLDALVLEENEKVRVFVGHAGWGPGQLESELEAGAWLPMPASGEYVFYEGADLWDQGSKKLRRSSLVDVLKIKHVPEDPSLN